MVTVIATAFVGSFAPTALLDLATPIRDTQTVLLAEEPPTAPIGCLIASCGKGSPAPATPVLTLAGLAAVAAVAARCISPVRRRRTPSAPISLPRGVALPLLHPPQFS